MADSETDEFHVEQMSERFDRDAAEEIREREFPVAVRGYDRRSVDEFVEEVYALIRELEGRQSREEVVQRALDQVGEETAGILQRAHSTADEITARSRAQAEGRIQRADREAELARRQADEYSEKVIVDTQLLWEERQRLLEDIRHLADDVLATADMASERLSLPEGLPPAEETAPEGDPPTAEVGFDLLQGGGEQAQAGEELVQEGEPTTEEQPTEYMEPLDPETLDEHEQAAQHGPPNHAPGR